MSELNWLEFAGVCGIGTGVLLLILLIVEVGKELLTKPLEPEDKKEKND